MTTLQCKDHLHRYSAMPGNFGWLFVHILNNTDDSTDPGGGHFSVLFICFFPVHFNKNRQLESSDLIMQTNVVFQIIPAVFSRRDL